MIRAIIPCAGFGTRMAMEANKSKELLIDPHTHRPMLEYHLDICTKYGLTPLIVTRAEKTDLIQYCIDNKIEYIIIEPKREWPHTVFESHYRWSENNILLLPDTKFEPHSIITDIKTDLSLGANTSIGLHVVNDPEKWCIVTNYTLWEKNKSFQGLQHQYAFGVIGFKRFTGLSLFGELNVYKKAFLSNASFRYLDSFRDITRTGKIE